jgi:hypothetical protein
MWFGDALDQQVKADADGWLTANAFGAQLTIPVGAAIDWLKTRDAGLMREVLNDTFIAPRVMWSPLGRETPEQVLESLDKLEPALRTRAKEFRKRHSAADQALGAYLEYWADAACLCAKAIRDGAKKGSRPGEHGHGHGCSGFLLGADRGHAAQRLSGGVHGPRGSPRRRSGQGRGGPTSGGRRGGPERECAKVPLLAGEARPSGLLPEFRSAISGFRRAPEMVIV